MNFRLHLARVIERTARTLLPEGWGCVVVVFSPDTDASLVASADLDPHVAGQRLQQYGAKLLEPDKVVH